MTGITVPRTTFITLTNLGYLPYTLNCVKSFRKLSTKFELICYAIGKDAYHQLSERRIATRLIPDEKHIRLESYRKGNWAEVVSYKFQIIYDNLLEFDYVCFVDGDIVFEDAKFIDYCLERIDGHDLLIQNDSLSDTNANNLCSGFMFIRSCPVTINIFNPAHVVQETKNGKGWGDQIYINQRKHELKFLQLPLALFPNGKYFRNEFRSIDPYLVHFNHVAGHDKGLFIALYRKCQTWRLCWHYISAGGFMRYLRLWGTIYIKRKKNWY